MSEHTGEQVRDLSWVRRAEIHPAIGFARLGNSPDEYFVGPEIPGVAPRPEDGRFKDAHGRIRRQAARFRCYGFDDTGTRHVELTGLTGQVSVDWGCTWSTARPRHCPSWARAKCPRPGATPR